MHGKRPMSSYGTCRKHSACRNMVLAWNMIFYFSSRAGTVVKVQTLYPIFLTPIQRTKLLEYFEEAGIGCEGCLSKMERGMALKYTTFACTESSSTEFLVKTEAIEQSLSQWKIKDYRIWEQTTVMADTWVPALLPMHVRCTSSSQ